MKLLHVSDKTNGFRLNTEYVIWYMRSEQCTVFELLLNIIKKNLKIIWYFKTKLWREDRTPWRLPSSNHVTDNRFDYLRFYVPLKNFSLIWRRHHCRWRAAKFRPMLGAQGLWAGRDLYRATPTVTRGLGFSGLIRRSRLLRHTRGCGGSILARILTGGTDNRAGGKWVLEAEFQHLYV
jgi:hypothetical protein